MIRAAVLAAAAGLAMLLAGALLYIAVVETYEVWREDPAESCGLQYALNYYEDPQPVLRAERRWLPPRVECTVVRQSGERVEFTSPAEPGFAVVAGLGGVVLAAASAVGVGVIRRGLRRRRATDSASGGRT